MLSAIAAKWDSITLSVVRGAAFVIKIRVVSHFWKMILQVLAHRSPSSLSLSSSFEHFESNCLRTRERNEVFALQPFRSSSRSRGTVISDLFWLKYYSDDGVYLDICIYMYMYNTRMYKNEYMPLAESSRVIKEMKRIKPEEYSFLVLFSVFLSRSNQRFHLLNRFS